MVTHFLCMLFVIFTLSHCCLWYLFYSYCYLYLLIPALNIWNTVGINIWDYLDLDLLRIINIVDFTRFLISCWSCFFRLLEFLRVTLLLNCNFGVIRPKLVQSINLDLAPSRNSTGRVFRRAENHDPREEQTEHRYQRYTFQARTPQVAPFTIGNF